MSRSRFAFIAVAVALATRALAVSEPSTPPLEVPASAPAEALPNYARLTPTLAAAGQPSAQGLAGLRASGFRTVVNLRTETEPGVQEEAEALRAQGLRYVSVPVTADTFSAADVERVSRVLADPESGPVLLHCGSSNRVGAVWAVLQAKAKGLTLEQAIEEGRRAGLSSASMIAAVKRVLAEPAR